MTKAERTAAARLRHEELVEILTGAVFDLFMRDRTSGRPQRNRGRQEPATTGAPRKTKTAPVGPASSPIREAGLVGSGGGEMVTWPAA